MSNITLTIPNDDHIALRAFGKALEEMALAHGAEPQGTLKHVDEIAEQAGIDPAVADAYVQGCHDTEARLVEVDTTTEQFAALAKMESADTEQPAKGLVQTEDGQFDLSTGAQVDSTGTPWDERIHSASKALNSDGTWRLRRKPKDMDEAEWAALVESIKNELQYREQLKEETEQSSLYTPENYVHMYRAIDNIYALAKSDVEVADFEADGYVRHTQEQYDAWEGPNTVDQGDDFHTDASVVAEQTIAGIPPIPVPPPVALPGSTGATDLLPPAPIPTAVPTLVDWTFPKLMTFLTERQGKIDVATVNMLLAQDGIASLPELNAHPDKIGPFVARVKAHLGE